MLYLTAFIILAGQIACNYKITDWKRFILLGAPLLMFLFIKTVVVGII